MGPNTRRTSASTAGCPQRRRATRWSCTCMAGAVPSWAASRWLIRDQRAHSLTCCWGLTAPRPDSSITRRLAGLATESSLTCVSHRLGRSHPMLVLVRPCVSRRFASLLTYYRSLLLSHLLACSPTQVCGQLVAMANFPPHIKPIVYGWPTGPKSTFAAGIHQGAESPEVQRDFAVFVEGLLAARVAKVHIITHSMATVSTHRLEPGPTMVALSYTCERALAWAAHVHTCHPSAH
jgi:hypothetical protein